MELQPAASTPIFSGYFSNWTSASDAALAAQESQITVEVFNSARWMNRQREMVVAARAGHSPRPTNLPLLAVACGAEFIVDLGGGSGWTSELLYQEENGKNKSYIVLEIPSVCDEFSNEFREESGVLFVSSISEVPQHLIARTDVLYANSVLQYFPDDSILTELISFLSPEWILLDDFVTSTDETFYSLQNYHGVHIPYRFSSLFDIQKTCTDLGYELMVNLDYPSPIATGWEVRILGDTDLGSSIGRNASLLFRRSS